MAKWTSQKAELGWFMGCALLLALLLGWPALSTAIALLREERVLSRLYWHLRIAVDRLLRR